MVLWGGKKKLALHSMANRCMASINAIGYFESDLLWSVQMNEAILEN